jgi:hypothetical protein
MFADCKSLWKRAYPLAGTDINPPNQILAKWIPSLCGATLYSAAGSHLDQPFSHIISTAKVEFVHRLYQDKLLVFYSNHCCVFSIYKKLYHCVYQSHLQHLWLPYMHIYYVAGWQYHPISCRWCLLVKCEQVTGLCQRLLRLSCALQLAHVPELEPDVIPDI